MRGVIYKLKSELKNDVIDTLNTMCSKKWIHQFGTINGRSDKPIPLNLYFLGVWQNLEDGFTTHFYFDESIALPQYGENGLFEHEAKRAIKVRLYVIDHDKVNNYILLCGSRVICNKLIKVLNDLIYQKIKKKTNPFMYVNFIISNDRINKMKKDKCISSLNLFYVDETDDTVIKSSKMTSKKDKDLTESDDFKRIGEISDRHKTIKCNSPKFGKKVTINEEGYFASLLSDIQFKALVICLIEEFEKVGIISEFNDILVSKD